MIQYEQPQYFYLLLLIPLMVLGYVLFSLWKKRVLKSLASAKMIDHIAPERSSFKGWLKQILFWLGWAFICLGLVNPQIGTELETVKREGVDLVFAIDVSKSMLAEDIAPNRLEKAKRLAGELINQLVSDRVGIIAYASSAIPHSLQTILIRPLIFSNFASRHLGAQLDFQIPRKLILMARKLSVISKSSAKMIIIPSCKNL